MILVIDIGNTSIKFGVYQGKKVLNIYLLSRKNLGFVRKNTRELLKKIHRKFPLLEEILICSVVPQVLRIIETQVKRIFQKNPKVIIAATRKTAPLLTYFDKRAVRTAGGEPHRYKLSDHILIKDNHLKIVGSVTAAVRQARKTSPAGKIEVEVNTLRDACEAARAGADVVMFDNVKTVNIRRAVKMLEREGLRDQITLEASGRIDLSNVGEYATTDVDMISSSYMTMRAPALDMGLDLKSKGFKSDAGKRKRK